MFKYSYESGTFSFYFENSENDTLPISQYKLIESDFLAQISILYELQDNGQATVKDNQFKVHEKDVLRLSYTDLKLLKLPDFYPFEIVVTGKGEIASSIYQFDLGFYDFYPHGNKINAKRNGIIIECNSVEYLLTLSQYEICESIDEFNILPKEEKGVFENFSYLSKIKNLSEDNSAILEKFLKNQKIFIPEKINLEINYNDGVLDIVPTINSNGLNEFSKNFDKFPSIKQSYSVKSEDNKQIRVLIDKVSGQSLTALKNKRKVRNLKEIDEIVEHPELFFDEKFVDFSVFYSDRVKEIGLYKPKFYPFATPYKSEWIPGILCKDKILGEKKIFFKTEDKLEEFKREKEEAKNNGKKSVQWENVEIPIEVAEDCINIAEQQFKSPKEPIVKSSKTGDEVLIIKENAELTEFVERVNLINNLTHKFQSIKNLKSEINLKEHQREGIAWLQSLCKEKFPGGLLADDMGLGKTLQLLYFIEWHAQTFKEDKPYLIVAPVSLLENWENEYEKFFKSQNLKMLSLYGTVPLTRENNPELNKRDAFELQKRQIILTNYETVRSYQISLGLVDFAVITLDEAQKVKTPGTLVTNAVKALKSDFKIAMTGTPVENSLVDIWCIMDFSVPGLLGNAKDFSKKYQSPLKLENTNVKELTENLRGEIGNFIKRRLKKDVAKDLPKKFDNESSRRKKEMPNVQLQRYKLVIEEVNDTELEGINRRNRILKSIWEIRDISDHPYLVDSSIKDFSSEELIETSSKLKTTVGLLTDIEFRNEKVIVFADRKETQKLLQKVIKDTFGIFSSIINGDTPSSQKKATSTKLSRQQTIDYFQKQNGFNVIIMSPIAAGVGLNVTEANNIIHYSRHWNPAKEEQATDRAYRIGQTKDVNVFYPMAIFPTNMIDDKGNQLKSFDEILDNLLMRKKALANNTLFPTEQAEVTPDEMISQLFSQNVESTFSPLNIIDLDKLTPNLFEASIAAIYKAQGFDVMLTPLVNDKGADIAIFRNDANYLIQVKQSGSKISNNAVQEITTAKCYYEEKYHEEFKTKVVSNNYFGESACILAASNNVYLVDRDNIENLLTKYQITLKDIYKIENLRLANI